VSNWKVFVTGGSGFIGSAVTAGLLDRGIELVNYDINPPIRAKHAQLWRQGDLANVEDMVFAMRSLRANAVIHLAARADINASAWPDFSSIHEGTKNLLEAIERHGKIERVVNVSTQLVIGPEHEPRSLLDFRPYTVYGEAKAYGEAALLQWNHSVDWFTVRPANIWGPHHPSGRDAIWKYINSGAYLHPAGSPVYRTYGYVENTADQIIRLLLADPAHTTRRVFYVADHVFDSFEWAQAFSLALTGRKVRRVPPTLFKSLGLAGEVVKRLGLPSPIDAGRALRLTKSYAVPLEATFQITGPPPVSFEEGLTRTVAWLRSTGAPYK
jgi:nucleoside-diphosphate-sugar epimerase